MQVDIASEVPADRQSAALALHLAVLATVGTHAGRMYLDESAFEGDSRPPNRPGKHMS